MKFYYISIFGVGPYNANSKLKVEHWFTSISDAKKAVDFLTLKTNKKHGFTKAFNIPKDVVVVFENPNETHPISAINFPTAELQKKASDNLTNKLYDAICSQKVYCVEDFFEVYIGSGYETATLGYYANETVAKQVVEKNNLQKTADIKKFEGNVFVLNHSFEEWKQKVCQNKFSNEFEK